MVRRGNILFAIGLFATMLPVVRADDDPSATLIPEIKKLIRSVTVEETVAVAREAMKLETARDVNNYLREQTRRILPEVLG